jgi:hypothetical protein
MTVDTKKLEETKGSFTLKGIIHGLSNDNSVREGVTSSDKDYKAVSFYIETSPNNRVRVEMFGMERDVVFYSSKEKKSKKVPFENRSKVNLKGYRLMGVNLNPTGSKTDRKTLIEYDAIDYLKENFKDGDSVYVSGQLDFSSFENKQGETVNKTGFRIQSISKEKEPIDFTEEDFVPHAFFKQDIVVSDLIEEENKLYINAKIIKYKGEITDTTFVVEADRLKKFAKTLKKNLKFGDFIQVKGWIVSLALEEEAQAEVEDDSDDWGGETPEGMDNSYIVNYINELQIVNVDKETYEPQKYTEEDLFSQEEEDYGEDVDDSDDGFEDEDDDGELPFSE